MKILGIQWGDNSTVCALEDNKILAAVGEERFTKKKNDMSYPLKSIKYCCSFFKNKRPDIVAVASKDHNYISQLTHFYSIPIKGMINLQNNYYYQLFYKNKDLGLLKFLKKYWKKKQYPKSYWSNVSKIKEKTFSKDILEIVSNSLNNINKKKIYKIEHHLCHANYAYYSSNFKNTKCLIFTIDGSGDYGINATISIGEKGKIKRVYQTKNAILGRIYSHMTLYLGMKRLEHEYKIMGLAPYSYSKIDKDIYKIFSDCLKFSGYKILFNKRPKDCFIHFKNKLDGYRFDLIASALQNWTENFIYEWVKRSIKHFKIKNIVFSGGVAMNAKAMGKLLEIKDLNKLWVPGAGQDDSLCLGAAMQINNDLKKKKFFNLESLYFGNDVDDEQEKFIKNLDKIKYKVMNYSSIRLAKFLKRGLVFGRCVGRMEFGPRSLGNRAIIADPRNFEIKKKINSIIKQRDFWMPFAPTVLDRFAKKYLINVKKSQSTHMSITYKVTTLGGRMLKAAIHEADNTARAQILKKNHNFQYYELINNFFKITKCGALLNTSLNLHGYPIVQNLADAEKVLNKSGLNGLVTKNYIILKR